MPGAVVGITMPSSSHPANRSRPTRTDSSCGLTHTNVAPPSRAHASIQTSHWSSRLMRPAAWFFANRSACQLHGRLLSLDVAGVPVQGRAITVRRLRADRTGSDPPCIENGSNGVHRQGTRSTPIEPVGRSFLPDVSCPSDGSLDGLVQCQQFRTRVMCAFCAEQGGVKPLQHRL